MRPCEIDEFGNKKQQYISDSIVSSISISISIRISISISISISIKYCNRRCHYVFLKLQPQCSGDSPKACDEHSSEAACALTGTCKWTLTNTNTTNPTCLPEEQVTLVTLVNGL